MFNFSKFISYLITIQNLFSKISSWTVFSGKSIYMYVFLLFSVKCVFLNFYGTSSGTLSKGTCLSGSLSKWEGTRFCPGTYLIIYSPKNPFLWHILTKQRGCHCPYTKNTPFPFHHYRKAIKPLRPSCEWKLNKSGDWTFLRLVAFEN